MKTSKNQTSKSLKKYSYPILILVTAIVLNQFAWKSQKFSDWYVEHVFPVWVSTYGRFSSLFNFSVGEVLIGLGIALVIITLISFLFKLSFYKKLVLFDFWILAIVSLIMVLNCFILYHTSTFAQRYGIEDTDHTASDVRVLRNYVVEQVNTLATKLQRDENQELVYTGDYEKQAKESMSQLGNLYSGLSGYYVTPKWIYSSKFLSQSKIMGYYFPFSLEANLNQCMYSVNIPATMCHELAHTKGFLYEDEANFIGYLACVQSEDLFFQYSGYMSILGYLDNAYFQSIGKDQTLYEESVQISDLVKKDDIFLTEAAWDEVNKTALIPTKWIEDGTDLFLTQNLTLNGVEEGIASYSQVVELLLDYYQHTLYE